MKVHIDYAIEKLKRNLLSLAALTEDQLRKSIRALETKDVELARTIIEDDRLVDIREVELEEDCLQILALHQPVAHDLRFVIAVLKINNDLERIADLASNLAERTLQISSEAIPVIPVDFKEMAGLACSMLQGSVDAFINNDALAARAICEADLSVDRLHRENYNFAYRAMQEHPEHSSRMLPMLSISRYLERAADYATNIAEDVVYLVEGKIIRHSDSD
ncbi:MAG: phosphate signaling complex protein PhoU [bacterium]|nr:phosphate signaling complex protein PhoU [bacterium]